MYGYGYSMGHDYMWHPLISIVWAIVVLIVAVVFLRHWRGSLWRHRSSALEMLRERYANGEISTAEYEERKKALSAE